MKEFILIMRAATLVRRKQPLPELSESKPYNGTREVEHSQAVSRSSKLSLTDTILTILMPWGRSVSL